MTAEDKFWVWFGQNERELFNFNPEREVEREARFDRLATELQKVDRDLCFEFSPRGGRREFVVSAGGIKRAFPAVVALVNAAPQLGRWDVIAFRPRRTVMTIEFQDKRIDPDDVQFTLLDNGRNAGVQLFIPRFKNDDVALKSIGFLLLDASLGEYDVETRLGPIEMLPPEAKTEGKRYPLVRLPSLFDQLIARLEGLTAKPV